MRPPAEFDVLDGNEAVARIAYLASEVCLIYPIAPSSPMGEFADQWSMEKKKNIWGVVPQVVEMQSEGGAAGAVHGALQAGSLATTFTASQGLLLMIPNMYKIAGELTPAVFHVAARSLATQALSIFGDHTDVMAARSTGFSMLSSGSVQEAQDLALIAHAATLETRIPVIHFFDGFRTSHEINKIELISENIIREMISDELIRAHRARALNPNQPFVRGTAHNPDVAFQARETITPFYERAPQLFQQAMDRFAALTGRSYHLFEYFGHPKADRAIVLMGSGAEAVRETIDHLNGQGERLGLLQVHLFRPFSHSAFRAALPQSVTALAVLDRMKEPGAGGEPLYKDVVASLASAALAGDRDAARVKRVIGGRYGLSSKEFTPAMIKAVFDELNRDRPKNQFTVGIRDDLSHSSLEISSDFGLPKRGVTEAIFYGLGADGTVGANKNSIKIIGESTPYFAQGYFVYDSKKSGSRTVSHLRFGPEPIRSTYLIDSANFIGCHQFNFVEKIDVLRYAAPGAIFLLNSPYGPRDVWAHLPGSIQRQIINKKLSFYVIDAYGVAKNEGMGTRINTIMQTCFFAISGVLPRDEAIQKIKEAIRKSYGLKGQKIVEQNFRAVDQTLKNLHQVAVPQHSTGSAERPALIDPSAPEFVRNVIGPMLEDRGDELPVSAFPNDGTYPSGSSQWEKRNISLSVPVWEPELCIQCGNCSFVCPHSCIRSKLYDQAELERAPVTFQSAPISGRGFPGMRYTLQVYVEDCTGCALCVDVCPVQASGRPAKRAINMDDKQPRLEEDRANTRFFESLSENDRSRVDFSTVRGVQFLQPLFEFSGACAGCGETPYLKVLSQLFGDRLLIANATGCSSIYGGNLPTTPWAANREGRGPAWSNSLFEDNAEFGLGFRLSADKHLEMARKLLLELSDVVGDELVNQIISAPQISEREILRQRERLERAGRQLKKAGSAKAQSLLSLLDHLVRRSVWIVGGDGWAYDIGFGGLDHVLASGKDVNLLVLDTEVYSNTGGQASKATPLGAVAKFASGGKAIGKKDLGLMAIAYGNVYVARIAMGANPQQTLLALREAEAYPGPSLILAYSHCIAHGIDMEQGLQQQHLAVKSGYWPLFRYNPKLKEIGENPMELDSPRPSIPLVEYAYNENRYSALAQSDPKQAERLLAMAQAEVDRTWDMYVYLAQREAPGKLQVPHPDTNSEGSLSKKTENKQQ